MLKYESRIDGLPPGRFQAEIRIPGGVYRPLFVGDASSCESAPHRHGGAEGFVGYAADEAVEVRFRFPFPAARAIFRPSLRENLPVAIDGNLVTLKLSHPRYGALEIECEVPGKAFRPCYTVYLFGDAPAEIPQGEVLTVAAGSHSRGFPADSNARLIRFEPGVHRFEGDTLVLRSGCTYFLERGAVLQCGVYGDRVEHVRILGQGIFDGSGVIRPAGVNHLSDGGAPAFFRFFRGSDILIDGPVIYNPPFWNIVPVGTERFTLRNHKALSWIGNNDGLQPRSCNDLLAEHCFFKCNDDGIAIKTRRAIGMISRRHCYRDLILWCDKFGNALEIGHSSQGDLLEDVRFENIEIIRGAGNAALDICIVDHSEVRRVIYENIYAEGKPSRYDFCFCVPDYLLWATDPERGRIREIAVRNFVSANPPQSSRIAGNAPDRRVETVRFEHLTFAGNVKVNSPEKLNLFTEHVSDIVFGE